MNAAQEVKVKKNIDTTPWKSVGREVSETRTKQKEYMRRKGRENTHRLRRPTKLTKHFTTHRPHVTWSSAGESRQPGASSTDHPGSKGRSGSNPTSGLKATRVALRKSKREPAEVKSWTSERRRPVLVRIPRSRRANAKRGHTYKRWDVERRTAPQGQPWWCSGKVVW